MEKYCLIKINWKKKKIHDKIDIDVEKIGHQKVEIDELTSGVR